MTKALIVIAYTIITIAHRRSELMAQQSKIDELEKLAVAMAIVWAVNSYPLR